MTSRPLFISVAESMLILGPIDQVGCLSASSGVTAASSAAARPRKGPPEPVRRSSSSAAPSPPAAMHWNSALCSLILPVDSEHSALFQCIAAGGEGAALEELLLTGSGGLSL